MRDIKTPIIKLKNITKNFLNVRALDKVDFELRYGEIHALVGENGAGKSTLAKIIAGIYKPDEGEIFYQGRKVEIRSPIDSKKLNINLISQEPCLVGYLTVAENVYMNDLPRNKFHFVNWKKLMNDAERIFSEMGVKLNPASYVRELSLVQQEMINFARALYTKSKVIIFDEPTACLTEKEKNYLFGVIKSASSQGVSIIYISHKLEEIFNIADRVTVLRNGKLISTEEVKKTDMSTLVKMILGREIDDMYGRASKKEIGPPLLRVENLTSSRSIVRNISFSLHRKEILGIYGLIGAGKSELVRMISGVDKVEQGKIFYNGKPIIIRNPRDAIRTKIGMIPEDRKREGLIWGFSVKKNLTLVDLRSLCTKIFRFLKLKKEKILAGKLVRTLNINTPSLDQKVRYLSGGNQQKVVIGKWLFGDYDVLIFDEATKGIDVGSKAEIYHLIRKLAKKGKAILFVSNEIPEIMGICDRVIVLYKGNIVANLDISSTTQEEVYTYAIRGESTDFNDL